jgi:hypothetical protein
MYDALAICVEPRLLIPDPVWLIRLAFGLYRQKAEIAGTTIHDVVLVATGTRVTASSW